MSFYDLPKVKITKPIKGLRGMSKPTAERKFAEKYALKKKLQAQLKKCEDDLMKYYLTMTKS